ncbi:MAG: hypothetical protein NZ521_07545 [Flammeovirgaceae bacterium]|nr:hypothetical protein [Flammeovirgaceae bacterium]MDW8288056.1 hypothetical protein [Flammeovirgaceae bacterium]
MALVFSVLLIRIYAEETKFVSFDSQCYLEVSQNLRDGKGAYFHLPSENPTLERYFAIWPLGYPLLLVLLSWTFFTNVFVASKLLNFIAILLITCVIAQKRPSFYPYFILLFCSFSALEVFSYTWSEGIFMAVLLSYFFVLSEYIRQPNVKAIFILFFLFLFALSIRYAGVFLWLVNVLVMLKFRLTNRVFVGMNLAVFVLFGLYLYHNYRMTGYPTGIERINTTLVSYEEFFRTFFISLLNVGLIVRKFTHFSDIAFYFTTLFQLVISYFLLKNFRWSFLKNTDLFAQVVLLGGTAYLFSIFSLTCIGAVSYFDYRTMFPIEFLAWLLWLYQLTRDENKQFFKKSKPYVVALFLFSLLFNLPKRFIANSFCQFSYICIQPQNYQSNVMY